MPLTNDDNSDSDVYYLLILKQIRLLQGRVGVSQYDLTGVSHGVLDAVRPIALQTAVALVITCVCTTWLSTSRALGLGSGSIRRSKTACSIESASTNTRESCARRNVKPNTCAMSRSTLSSRSAVSVAFSTGIPGSSLLAPDDRRSAQLASSAPSPTARCSEENETASLSVENSPANGLPLILLHMIAGCPFHSEIPATGMTKPRAYRRSPSLCHEASMCQRSVRFSNLKQPQK
ncbi:hypothetical protein DBV15_00994 [Temnothorax longispinosus]|uniref:Uncharacterized protein n=1 Tax=Temnothorax longispinosus TaxID=300112 RepID=A0A4S2JCV0_9HYME|nr:hypothetical protein DBV15_00994 [Temnothorax longispinosus]